MEDKYRLINYFDVWYSDNEGWQVNNLCEEEGEIRLSTGTHNEIVTKLIQFGFLKPTITPDMIDIWNDYEMIEFFDTTSGRPLGRLELIRD